MKDKIKSAVERIETMEQLFDKASFLCKNGKNGSDELTEALETLKEYYESGQWLYDYELDEKGLLPKGLKRGVLSQDGLYDLISDSKNMYKM